MISINYYYFGLGLLIFGALLFLVSFFMNTNTDSQKNNQNAVYWLGLLTALTGAGIFLFWYYSSKKP